MKKAIILIISSLILFFSIKGYFDYKEKQYQNYLTSSISTDKNTRIPFIIKEGETADIIATNLQKKNIIISDWAFVRYVKEKGYDKNLKKGDFILLPSDTIPIIADKLTGSIVEEIKLTIPEGYTIKQINQRLKEKGVVKKNEFLECTEKCTFDLSFLQGKKSLEGFLFPSTYFINPSSFAPETFIQKLLSKFDQQITPYKKDIPEGKLYDIVIMASLIEKEAKTDEERPIVAGILWKRIQNNWYLGVDATIRYYKNDWTSPITYDDLEDKNPYNTRNNLGLPPTPIANPGIESLKASIYPEKTEYWYYLHDKEGNIHYAKTNTEHNMNKATYLY